VGETRAIWLPWLPRRIANPVVVVAGPVVVVLGAVGWARLWCSALVA
jgi:hypothetical protein